jgi:hypothetical protein
MAGLCLVGGDPPGAAAGHRPEPDVILGYEGDELVVKVREAEVSGRSHRLILGCAGPYGPPEQLDIGSRRTGRNASAN